MRGQEPQSEMFIRSGDLKEGPVLGVEVNIPAVGGRSSPGRNAELLRQSREGEAVNRII